MAPGADEVVRLIGRLADRSTITTTEQGTTVRMCWAGPPRSL